MSESERGVDYWREQAEQSDRHKWCGECLKSYFTHFGTCPHCRRRRRSVDTDTDRSGERQ